LRDAIQLYNVGIDSQSPQFFPKDSSNNLGFSIGVDSKQVQFFNDDSYGSGIGLGTETYFQQVEININYRF
jgi:hypothetical protein